MKKATDELVKQQDFQKFYEIQWISTNYCIYHIKNLELEQWSLQQWIFDLDISGIWWPRGPWGRDFFNVGPGELPLKWNIHVMNPLSFARCWFMKFMSWIFQVFHWKILVWREVGLIGRDTTFEFMASVVVSILMMFSHLKFCTFDYSDWWPFWRSWNFLLLCILGTHWRSFP